LRDTSADGLRGLAALNVVIAHFFVGFWPKVLFPVYGNLQINPSDPSGLEKVLGWPVITFFFNGHFAVMIFFVLSGYVLATPAVENDFQRIRQRFWGRYLRLNIPVAAACTISWCVLWLGLYASPEAALVSNSKWLARFFQADVSFLRLLNVAVIQGLLADAILLSPLWTLRIEFIGSMMLLATLMLSPKNRQTSCLLLVGIAIVAAWPNDVLFLMCFFAGALCNWVTVGPTAARVLLVLGFVFGSYQPYGVDYMLPELTREPKTLYNAIGGVCLTLAVCRGGALRAVLSSAIVQYLGKVSYSLYLVHTIVLCSIASYIVSVLGVGVLGLSFAFAVYIPVTFVVSHVFTDTVDRFAVRIGHRFAKSISSSMDVLGDKSVKAAAE
jgi:peptidoglycan/LPS O-acetylase OafA/YrhL